MKKIILHKLLPATLFVFILQSARSQFLVEMLDTTRDDQKGLYYSLKKLDHIRFSGYMQPQYQVAGSKGARNFSGGDFSPQSNNRFMLRRGRLRFDFAGFNKDGRPSVQFVFQFDGTERGVFIRDFWGRFYENKLQLFSVTAGMFARPFGYELNLSSSDRESPERGRASQILMRTERDLGAMISLESRRHENWLHYFKLDAGLFNGQGLSATTDFDSYKDFIARAALKPFPLSKTILLSTGISFFQGGFLQNSRYIYRTETRTGEKIFAVDSSLTNMGAKSPRRYRGADVQLKVLHDWGATELRAEYWRGTQTATAANSETPAFLLGEPHYIRKFDAAFFIFLQNIINKHHQLGIKYDWYDPNTGVSGGQIGKAGANFTPADIRYNTLGGGYIYYANSHVKLTLWYDHIKNESTTLTGFTRDLDDDVFTCRLQFRF